MLTLALLRDSSDLHIYKICMGKITIVPVTYEHVAILEKIVLPCFSWVFFPSCVVFEPIYGHSVGFRETGFLSLYIRFTFLIRHEFVRFPKLGLPVILILFWKRLVKTVTGSRSRYQWVSHTMAWPSVRSAINYLFWIAWQFLIRIW